MKRFIVLAFALLTVLFFSSCSTPRHVQKTESDAKNSKSSVSPRNTLIDDNFSINTTDFFDIETIESHKFIFLRLYDVRYVPIRSASEILNVAIGILGAAPNGITYDHAAISYKLSDDFIGLTSNPLKNAIQIEKAQQKDKNSFMNRNDRQKSLCTVIAIPCSLLEYENCKTLLDYALKGEKYFVYDIFEIAAMPAANKGNKEKLKNYQYEDFSSYKGDTQTLICAIDDPAKVFESYNYVCSTFCSFVLYNSLQSFRNICDQTGAGPQGVTPSELFCLPGAKVLFHSFYADYDKTLQAFLKKYPQFSLYL